MCFALAAMSPSDSLPTDLAGLRALLLAERAHHAEELERLTAIIKELQRHRFGRRAERLDAEQLALALEDVEQTADDPLGERARAASCRLAGISNDSHSAAAGTRRNCVAAWKAGGRIV
jgi:Transposase C of IS166 homeodomain